jgi:hypothetical protein
MLERAMFTRLKTSLAPKKIPVGNWNIVAWIILFLFGQAFDLLQAHNGIPAPPS